MTEAEVPPARASVVPNGTVAAVSLFIAALGAAFYGWVCFVVLPALDPPNFGTTIYDQAWLALMEGRLDLPARVLRFEGHYAPDGTGYLYHGAAPLITRALAAPFIEIGSVSLAPWSIWLWAVVGTAFYHRAFLTAAAAPHAAGGQVGHTGQARALIWSAVLAVTLWFGGPGLILASNISFYHEPIAVAYGLGGIALWLWGRSFRAGGPEAGALIGLAICAAVMVHARPHLAVALYVGVCLSLLWVLLRSGRRALVPVAVSFAILGAGGGSYLALNEARFGSPLQAHGSFDGEGVQYGLGFWGIVDPDEGGFNNFRNHGRFNPRRIPPNAMVYAASPPHPLGFFAPYYDGMQALHGALTVERPRVGYVRLEPIHAGTFWIWTSGMIVALASVAAGRTAWIRMAGPVLTGFIAAGFILSYPTVTMRYHIDLWLAIAPFAFLGISAVFRHLARVRFARPAPLLLAAACATGIIFNVTMADVYRIGFQEHSGGFFGPWSEELCREKARDVGLAPDDIEVTCRPPLAPATAAGAGPLAGDRAPEPEG